MIDLFYHRSQLISRNNCKKPSCLLHCDYTREIRTKHLSNISGRITKEKFVSSTFLRTFLNSISSRPAVFRRGPFCLSGTLQTACYLAIPYKKHCTKLSCSQSKISWRSPNATFNWDLKSISKISLEIRIEAEMFFPKIVRFGYWKKF